MTHPTRSQYLEGKVLTASQSRLHLMLLEGALRFGQQARNQWDDQDKRAEVEALLTRTIDIVEELCMGAAAGKLDISKQLEEQYAFLFRELMAARINHDLEKLDASLRLLEFERETWKLACDLEPEAETATKRIVPASHLDTLPVESGLSLEA